MISHNRIRRLRGDLEKLGLLLRIPDPDYHRKALTLLDVIQAQARSIDYANREKPSPEAQEQGDVKE